MAKMTKKHLVLIAIVLLLSFSFISLQSVKATTYYTYVFYGPEIQETNSYSGTTITLTLIGANSSQISTVSLSQVVSPLTVKSTTQITSVSWVSSAPLNYTSQIVFNPAVTGTQSFDIQICDPSYPTFIYTFPITDFAGMTNAYISDSNQLGSVEEQFSLQSVSSPSFVMQEFRTYTLTISCDQGSYSQQFNAGPTQSSNIQVLAGAFGNTNYIVPTATATRITDNALTYNYFDINGTTLWVNFIVNHLNGQTIVYDSTHNETVNPNGYSATVSVPNADTDYFVQVVADVNGSLQTWNIPCGSLLVGTNPFEGKLDFLGTWPAGIDPAQLFAAAIIMCGLGIGSKFSTGASCIIAAILAGIFIAMGWFTLSIPMISLALVFGVLVYIAEQKEIQGR